MGSQYPTEDDPEPGPECPDCGGATERWRNDLSDNEYTVSVSCTECDFEIETESNLARRDRLERITDQAH